MNILVVGGGGREHAIIHKLTESPKVSRIYAAPGNGGIAALAECVPIKATDLEKMVEFAVSHAIDFCVSAPDDPLVLGMADAMEKAGIRCFGPNRAAAVLEGSKVFSKNLMKKYGIPTAAYETYSDPAEAMAYVRGQNRFPTVIKADGLALGKGVLIAEDLAAAEEGIRSIMEDRIFGQSGSRIVIEEFLTGPEVSVLAFTDSHTIVPMVSAMDHKRALDGDCGLNTGGMGSIAPNPFLTPELLEECRRSIFVPTMEAMNQEGRPFKGVIFFGLMLTSQGPKVIEYNCRFGDPEAQSVLPLLESDLLEIFEACADERLAEVEIRFSDRAAACVMMASGGYPVSYESGKEISGLEPDGQSSRARVYHSGTRLEDGRYYTAGGRVLGVCGSGATVAEALEQAYQAVGSISFDQAHYRKDIGRRALEAGK